MFCGIFFFQGSMKGERRRTLEKTNSHINLSEVIFNAIVKINIPSSSVSLLFFCLAPSSSLMKSRKKIQIFHRNIPEVFLSPRCRIHTCTHIFQSFISHTLMMINGIYLMKSLFAQCVFGCRCFFSTSCSSTFLEAIVFNRKLKRSKLRERSPLAIHLKGVSTLDDTLLFAISSDCEGREICIEIPRFLLMWKKENTREMIQFTLVDVTDGKW